VLDGWSESNGNGPSTHLSVDDLCCAVIGALEPGNGRSNRCEVRVELPKRLADAGVDASSEQLAEALVRLEDSACIQRVQRQPFGAYPQHVVHSGMKQFDSVD
jgi:hypothetical protein